MILSLFSPLTLALVYGVTAAAAIMVAVTARRSWCLLLPAAAGGAALGAALSWWLGDVLDLFEISPTWVDRIWVGAVCAVLLSAAVAVAKGPILRRLTAIVLVPLVLVSGALAINRDAGLFPTVADALGTSDVPRLVLPDADSPATGAVRTWRPPTNLPEYGRYGSVTIPGATSHFSARDAIVYLPPAALVEHAPRLPVVMMLSGQGPGAAPSNIIDAGHMITRLDRLAATHHGVAPIVVMPDQLATSLNNPMCVDGPLGNSATYLTRDVPAWIEQHLRVDRDHGSWAISGFSQGGTCALQLGASHPDLFRAFIDVSGQAGPTLKNTADTIRRGFHGDEAAYQAALPQHILASHAPYQHSEAFFAVGANDSRYGPIQPRVAAMAQTAGIHVTTHVVAASGHDWHTAGLGLEAGLTWLYPRIGLASQ